MALVDVIASQLRKRGYAQASVATDEEADEWRRAARAAARRIARPIETAQQRHLVIASLRDWPANALEEEMQDAEMHNAMHRVASARQLGGS